MARIIDVESELQTLLIKKEQMRNEILRLEGISEFYNKLIENNVVQFKVPMTEHQREVYQKMLEDDDI